jgi:hypothetical protein
MIDHHKKKSFKLAHQQSAAYTQSEPQPQSQTQQKKFSPACEETQEQTQEQVQQATQ